VIFKTPLNTTKTLLSQDNSVSSVDAIYSGNKFTSVPPSFSGTSSPKPKKTHGARHSISSLSPSRPPALGLSVAGTSAELDALGSSKRGRGQDADGDINMMEEPTKKKVKKA
jgi:hypothetical protein